MDQTPHGQHDDPSVARDRDTAPTAGFGAYRDAGHGPHEPQGPYGSHHASPPYAHDAGYAPYPGHSAAPAPLRRRTAPIVVAVVAAGLLGGGLGAGGVALLDHNSSSAPTALTAQPASATVTSASPGSIPYAAQVASKSTADLTVTGQSGEAVGSGIILTRDGYVLTNNHVVSGVGQGGRIQVTLPDGSTHSATVRGVAPSYDLAVVKVDGVSNLTPAVLGQSSGVQVGQQVVAVGSPENLSNTVTSGIVSNLSRTVTASDDSGQSVAVYNGLQTDTPINPGNSGGPLVNLQGQVVGVNSAVDTGQASQGGVQAFGLGFAIPVDTARRVADQLMQDGSATKPILGVSGSLSGSDSSSSVTGAQVTGVTEGGAAAKAGIARGDVITKVNGVPIGNYADLMAQILKQQPGQSIPLTVQSGGSSKTVTVTLGTAKDTATTTVPARQQQEQQQQSPFGGGSPFGQDSPFGGLPFG